MFLKLIKLATPFAITLLCTIIGLGIVLYSSTSVACKDPDYSYWLNLSDKELKANGCVREEIEMDIHNRNHNVDKVLEIGKRLRKRGVLNSDKLKIEADALYSVKRFNEALDIYLLSQSAANQCKAESTCGEWEYSTSINHYTLYKYYKAANKNVDASVEFNKGNIEFAKSCQLESNDLKYCDKLKRSLFLMLGI